MVMWSGQCVGRDRAAQPGASGPTSVAALSQGEAFDAPARRLQDHVLAQMGETAPIRKAWLDARHPQVADTIDQQSVPPKRSGRPDSWLDQSAGRRRVVVPWRFLPLPSPIGRSQRSRDSVLEPQPRTG